VKREISSSKAQRDKNRNGRFSSSKSNKLPFSVLNPIFKNSEGQKSHLQIFLKKWNFRPQSTNSIMEFSSSLNFKSVISVLTRQSQKWNFRPQSTNSIMEFSSSLNFKSVISVLTLQLQKCSFCPQSKFRKWNFRPQSTNSIMEFSSSLYNFKSVISVLTRKMQKCASPPQND